MTGQVIWITGLSGVGKTTLSEELNFRLFLNTDKRMTKYFYAEILLKWNSL